MKRFIIYALLALSFSSCKKDDDHTPFEGTITITAPQPNATIQGGSSFTVTGTISGNMEMHGYHVVVYNQNDQSVVYENSHHDHASSYTLNETISHTLTSATPLRLFIEASGDHDGSTVTKEVLFTYAP
jgi:hypothetical protein